MTLADFLLNDTDFTIDGNTPENEVPIICELNALKKQIKRQYNKLTILRRKAEIKRELALLDDELKTIES